AGRHSLVIEPIGVVAHPNLAPAKGGGHPAPARVAGIESVPNERPRENAVAREECTMVREECTMDDDGSPSNGNAAGTEAATTHNADGAAAPRCNADGAAATTHNADGAAATTHNADGAAAPRCNADRAAAAAAYSGTEAAAAASATAAS